jgi:hypothetical protein
MIVGAFVDSSRNHARPQHRYRCGLRPDALAAGGEALMDWQTFPHQADISVRGSGATLGQALLDATIGKMACP